MSLIEEKYDIYHSHPVMWTLDSAKPISDKLGAEIVGSVITNKQSKHDLDLRIENYDRSHIVKVLSDMGFEWIGSQVVSPEEIRKTGKTYGVGWQRGENFQDKNHRRIQVWHNEI